MAITINKQPSSKFNPVYNPLVYEIDSTNRNKPGFRYITQVKSTAAGNPLLFEKNVIPEFGTGLGNIHLNRELSDYVDYYFDPNLTNAISISPGTSLRHKIEFGEEYFESWDWEDFFFVGNTTVSGLTYNPNNLVNATSLVVRKSTGVSAPYSIGDMIFVTLNPGTQDRPQIGGVQEVLFVDDVISGGIPYWRVILNLAHVGSGVSTGGESRYADNRKTRFLGENVELGTTAIFNGTFSFQDWNTYNSNDYILSGTTSLPLSQVYDGYKIREGGRLYINFYNEPNPPTKIRFRNDSGEVYDYTVPASTVEVRTVNVGLTRTSFGTIIVGSGLLIKPTTKSYSFQFYNGTTPTSKEITLSIDRSCPIDKSIELQFLDKMGAFLPFYFNLMNIETHNINRSTYTSHNGSFGASKWENELTQGGSEVYASGYETGYLLRTDFLSDKDAKFFHNVVESPVTFINLDGQLLRCVIETNTVEVKKEKWFELKRYEIRVKLSNAEKINI